MNKDDVFVGAVARPGLVEAVDGHDAFPIFIFTVLCRKYRRRGSFKNLFNLRLSNTEEEVLLKSI